MTEPDRETQADTLRALLARLRLGVSGGDVSQGEANRGSRSQATDLAELPELVDALERLLLTQGAAAERTPRARSVETPDDTEDLERLLFERTQALEVLQEQHRAYALQQEQAASRQAVTIERLRLRLDQLGAAQEDSPGRHGSEQHHRRFAVVRAHPLVEDALDPTHASTSVEKTMDAPLFSRANFQPRFQVREDASYDVTDFLALHDRSFVRAAYLAILRREPDPQGAENYVALVRSGHPKARLLHEFLVCDEGRLHTTRIRGLETHLRVLRWCEWPIIGRAVSAVLFLANVNGHLRDLRVLENHVIRVAEESQAVTEANLGKLRSLGR